MTPTRKPASLVNAAITALSLLLLPGFLTGQEETDLRTIDLPEWTLEEEFRLGSVNGEHDAFVRLVRVRVDGTGRLYVLDAGLPGLRVFDRTGTYLHQIGRQGEGPGEYTAPVNFGLMGDTIWIVDGPSRRVAFFGEGGRVLDDFVLEPGAPGVEPPQPVEVLGPDDFLVVTPRGPGRYFQGHGVGPVLFEQSMVRRNRTGSRADTLARYTVESGFIVTQADGGGFGVVPYQPIRQQPQFSYYPEREEIARVERAVAARSDRGEFRVTIRRPDGTVVADRRLAYRPMPIPESIRDSIRDDMASRMDRDQTAGAAKRREVALEHLALPDLLPPVSLGMAVGEDGTRWIAREALPGVTSTRYLITTEDLHPLATVELPPAALRIAGGMDRDHVWLLVKDEWDVQYLVRYRIDRS